MCSHVGIDIDHIQRELTASAETSLASRSNRKSGRRYGVGNTRCNELAVRVGAEARTEVACGSDQGSGVLPKFAFGGNQTNCMVNLSRSNTSSAEEKYSKVFSEIIHEFSIKTAYAE